MGENMVVEKDMVASNPSDDCCSPGESKRSVVFYATSI
jgi:hypothetical protein